MSGNAPLADLIRPQSLDDVVGQKHILNKNMPLRKMIENGEIQNLIFFGPPGTGKTTVAEICAKTTNKRFVKLNGTSAKTADLHKIIEESQTLLGFNGIILYLDEIQYLNKKQQQTILEHIENGNITLISSTTENPYFYVYSAIISRSVVFEFMPVNVDDIKIAIKRAVNKIGEQRKIDVEIEDTALDVMAFSAMGDVRKSINFAEFCFYSSVDGNDKITITKEVADNVCLSAKSRYDKDSDMHYDILSAFQKSIRGSDVNGSLHYLARLLESGDIISPSRRLLVIASEDIGLAFSQGAQIVKSLVDSAFQLGLPEARIPLAHATMLLANSPKSNSVINAIDMAINDIRRGNIGDIPPHLKDAHYSGAQKLGRGIEYKYPHAFKNNYVKQQYLPDEIKNAVYYEPGNNKNEQTAKDYWFKIKGE